MKSIKTLTKNVTRITRDIFDAYTPLERSVYIMGAAMSITGIALTTNKKTRNMGLSLMAISSAMSVPLVNPTIDAAIASVNKIHDEHIVDNVLGEDAKFVFYWLHEKKWKNGGKVAITGNHVAFGDADGNTVGMPVSHYHSVVRVYHKQDRHDELMEYVWREFDSAAS